MSPGCCMETNLTINFILKKKFLEDAECTLSLEEVEAISKPSKLAWRWATASGLEEAQDMWLKWSLRQDCGQRSTPGWCCRQTWSHRESTSGGGAKREGARGSEAGSMLTAQSPTWGLSSPESQIGHSTN